MSFPSALTGATLCSGFVQNHEILFFAEDRVHAACVDSHQHLTAPGRWASDFKVRETSFGTLDEVCSHRLSER